MSRTLRRECIKMGLDILMVVSFLLLMEPKATGLSLHEWGGLGVAAIYVLHMMLNWSWIKSVTVCFFDAKVKGSTRLHYCVDLLLLLGFTLIIMSGMAIAKTIDFKWLFGSSQGGIWRGLHLLASLIILPAVGIHIGLHWDWIAARCRWDTRLGTGVNEGIGK